jgi:Protein of unknown function (DUF1566)
MLKNIILICFVFAAKFSSSQNIGIGTAIPNPNAIVDINDPAKGLLIPRMDSVHRKNIPNTKGMMVYDTSNNFFWFNTGTGWRRITASGCSLSNGDTYAGGIIFYLDASGCHGLVAAPVDQGTGAAWNNGNYNNNNAWGDGIGAGKSNTMMVSQYPASTLCLSYTGGGFTDWYLPSRFELNLMYLNLNLLGLGNFAGSFYWSSSEFNATDAHYQNFYNGLQDHILKLSSFHVRAVRIF